MQFAAAKEALAPLLLHLRFQLFFLWPDDKNDQNPPSTVRFKHRLINRSLVSSPFFVICEFSSCSESPGAKNVLAVGAN